MDVARTRETSRWPRWGTIAAIALAGSIGISAALARAKAAAPIVDRASLWVGVAARGPMLREVKGPGVLVPEHIRFITAETAGRVERIHARAGANVDADSLLVELSNPDIVLQALQSDREVAMAASALIERRARLEAQSLTERETVATLQSMAADAERRARAAEAGASEVFTQLDAQQASARAIELTTREALAVERADVAARTLKDEVAAHELQVKKQRTVAEFRKQQVDALHVRAGGSGVVQEMPLELGQWVTPGTILAKVVEPTALKAVVRVAEALARDIAPGQEARIDTRNGRAGESGIARGHVARIATAAHHGTVDIEVTLEGALPKGARPDLTIDGVIEIERMGDVLSIPRPVGAMAESSVSLFRLAQGEESASRVRVALGRESASAIEVRQGLNEGDRVVLSDMSRWDTIDQVRIR